MILQTLRVCAAYIQKAEYVWSDGQEGAPIKVRSSWLVLPQRDFSVPRSCIAAPSRPFRR